MSIKVETKFHLKCEDCKFDRTVDTDQEYEAIKLAEDHLDETGNNDDDYARPNVGHTVQVVQIKTVRNKY